MRYYAKLLPLAYQTAHDRLGTFTACAGSCYWSLKFAQNAFSVRRSVNGVRAKM
jgi:hypothetical protein